MSSPYLKNKKHFNAKIIGRDDEYNSIILKIKDDTKSTLGLKVVILNERNTDSFNKHILDELSREYKLTKYPWLTNIIRGYGSAHFTNEKIFMYSFDFFETSLKIYCEEYFKTHKRSIPILECMNFLNDILIGKQNIYSRFHY